MPHPMASSTSRPSTASKAGLSRPSHQLHRSSVGLQPCRSMGHAYTRCVTCSCALHTAAGGNGAGCHWHCVGFGLARLEFRNWLGPHSATTDQNSRRVCYHAMNTCLAAECMPMRHRFQRLLVVDEWDAAGADNVTWSMHFAGAVVNIAADGRTATLARSGATIHATILEPALGTVAGEAIGFSVHGSFFPHFLWFSLFYFLAFSAPFSSAKGSQTYLRCQKET
eukprot:m.352539 g.352539  ORF g.352539 m.352539 type:complete len:224 (+) comp20710_c0_seq9:2309-2980(+)